MKKMIAAMAAVVLSVIVNMLPASAQLTDSQLAQFDAFCASEQQRWGIPGMAVGVVYDGKVIFAKGYGVTDLDDPRPVNAATAFQTGSVSKSFTAALLAQAVDEGKLSWDDRVIKYLPDFAFQDRAVSDEFRVRDIVAMDSGLPERAADALCLMGYNRQYIIGALRHIKAAGKYPDDYAYQNNVPLLADAVLKAATGENWGQRLRRKILTAADMKNSACEYNSFANNPNAAHGHYYDYWTEKVTALGLNRDSLDPYYVIAPAGGITASAEDLCKWMIVNMDGGKYQGRQIMSSDNVKYLHQPRTSSKELGGWYCEGWISQKDGKKTYLWHNGLTIGFSSMMFTIPEDRLGVIVLTNLSGHQYATATIHNNLALLFYGAKLRDDSAAYQKQQDEFDQTCRKEIADWRALPDIKPEKPAAYYCGVYANPVYGRLEISITAGKLQARFLSPRPLHYELRPLDKNLFALENFSPCVPQFGNATFAGGGAQAEALIIPALEAEGTERFERAG